MPKKKPPFHALNSPVKPAPMTPAQAMEYLRIAMRTRSFDPTLVEPLGVLMDHVWRLEQFANLVLSAVISATRDLPPNATSRKRPHLPTQKK